MRDPKAQDGELGIQVGHYQKMTRLFLGGDKYFFDFATEDIYALAHYNFAPERSHRISVRAETHDTEYSCDARFKREMTLWGYSVTCNIDILNALNRRNVTDRNLDYKRTQSPQDFKLEDQVGMGIILAISMSVSF